MTVVVVPRVVVFIADFCLFTKYHEKLVVSALATADYVVLLATEVPSTRARDHLAIIDDLEATIHDALGVEQVYMQYLADSPEYSPERLDETISESIDSAAFYFGLPEYVTEIIRC